MNDTEGIYNQVCFHAQQCVEKALKGLLEHRGYLPPPTHKLADLIPLTESMIAEDLEDEIRLLDRFYIPTRYPDALPGLLPDGLPEKDAAQEALSVAKRVLEEVSCLLAE
ncbi:MAG: HEPN domain-containing protein [Bacillota bacterium]|nr:HEPN domain-containing protein [Bacillota bacterium]